MTSAIPVRCSTDWASPEAGQVRVQFIPVTWREDLFHFYSLLFFICSSLILSLSYTLHIKLWLLGRLSTGWGWGLYSESRTHAAPGKGVCTGDGGIPCDYIGKSGEHNSRLAFWLIGTLVKWTVAFTNVPIPKIKKFRACERLCP